MDKWQRTFASKLESVRMHWLERFERIAEESIAPAFAEFDAFTTARGFAVTSPACDAGARLYRFCLTENAYLLVWFRLQGFEAIEAQGEVCVPGSKPRALPATRAHLPNVDLEWVREQFRVSLDRFVDAFDESSKAQAARQRQQAQV